MKILNILIDKVVSFLDLQSLDSNRNLKNFIKKFSPSEFKPSHIAITLLTAVIISLALNIRGQFLLSLFWFFYPFYQSHKALLYNQDNIKSWMIYWIIYSLFAILENIFEIFISFIPFYNLFKLAFIASLYHEKTNLCREISKMFIKYKPQLEMNSEDDSVIGILIDVSGSMQESLNFNGKQIQGSKQSKIKEIFQFVYDISKNKSNEKNQMFTIAFGTKGHGLTLAECSTYPDCLDLISILTTTNQIKKNIKNQQNFSNDQNFNKNLTHKQVIKHLKENGAPLIDDYIKEQQLKKLISAEDAYQLLLVLKDNKFKGGQQFIDNLPIVCRDKISNQVFQKGEKGFQVLKDCKQIINISLTFDKIKKERKNLLRLMHDQFKKEKLQINDNQDKKDNQQKQSLLFYWKIIFLQDKNQKKEQKQKLIQRFLNSQDIEKRLQIIMQDQLKKMNEENKKLSNEIALKQATIIYWRIQILNDQQILIDQDKYQLFQQIKKKNISKVNFDQKQPENNNFDSNNQLNNMYDQFQNLLLQSFQYLNKKEELQMIQLYQQIQQFEDGNQQEQYQKKEIKQTFANEKIQQSQQYSKENQQYDFNPKLMKNIQEHTKIDQEQEIRMQSKFQDANMQQHYSKGSKFYLDSKQKSILEEEEIKNLKIMLYDEIKKILLNIMYEQLYGVSQKQQNQDETNKEALYYYENIIYLQNDNQEYYIREMKKTNDIDNEIELELITLYGQLKKILQQKMSDEINSLINKLSVQLKNNQSEKGQSDQGQLNKWIQQLQNEKDEEKRYQSMLEIKNIQKQMRKKNQKQFNSNEQQEFQQIQGEEEEDDEDPLKYESEIKQTIKQAQNMVFDYFTSHSQIINFLKSNGAPFIENYISIKTAKELISASDASKILSVLQEDQKRAQQYINNLPLFCKNKIYNGSLQAFQIIKKLNPVSFYQYYQLNQNQKELFNNQQQKIIKYESQILEQIKEAKIMVSEYFINPQKRKVQDAAKYLENLVHDDKQINQQIEAIEPYIYGSTPMRKALQQSLNIFQSSNAKQKILFVISDGESTDGDPLELAVQLKEEENVNIVSIFLTNKNINNPRCLYFEKQKNWERGANIMFDMSSMLNNKDKTLIYLCSYNWDIQGNSEFKLFLQANHPDIISEFTSTMGNLYRNNDVLLDLIGRIPLANYINIQNKNFKAKEQIGGTCFANAVAACLHLAMSRVYERDGGVPKFEDLRDEIEDLYYTKNNHHEIVLEMACKKYRLNYKQVSEIEAKQALNKQRPLVAIFSLDAVGWMRFSKFFNENKKGILQHNFMQKIPEQNEIKIALDDYNIKKKNDYNINKQKNNNKNTEEYKDTEDIKDTMEGHAVVLIRYDASSLGVMNSWGEDWADGGFFKIENADTLNLIFYDIYFLETGLTQNEKNKYRIYGEEYLINIFNQFVNSLKNLYYQCPLCYNTSELNQFIGHVNSILCPKCKKKFKPSSISDVFAKVIYWRSY